MIFLSILLGLIIGSFLSMLIPRLHEDKKGIVAGRSECPHCKHVLRPIDLIPLLSYLLLRGRCAHCKKPISAWYPLTELCTAALFAALYILHPDLQTFLSLAPLFTVLLFIFFYDLRYKEIHDAVMAPAIVYALFWSFQNGTIIDALIGAGIALVFFGGQYLLSKGRWLGSGDLRIGAFMGLMLGWQNVLIALFLSYILGSLVGIGLLVSKKASAETAVPLGPFLVVGTLLTYFWGTELLNLYLNLSL